MKSLWKQRLAFTFKFPLNLWLAKLSHSLSFGKGRIGGGFIYLPVALAKLLSHNNTPSVSKEPKNIRRIARECADTSDSKHANRWCSVQMLAGHLGWKCVLVSQGRGRWYSFGRSIWDSKYIGTTFVTIQRRLFCFLFFFWRRKTCGSISALATKFRRRNRDLVDSIRFIFVNLVPLCFLLSFFPRVYNYVDGRRGFLGIANFLTRHICVR